MNPVNPPITYSFDKISFPFLILSKAWIISLFFLRSVVSLEILIDSNDCGLLRIANWYGSIWFSTVATCFNFSLTFTRALYGYSKTFLIPFFGCTNIILVLCEVVVLLKSSSLKSSVSIKTAPALHSAISPGHAGCLSDSSSVQHSFKYNTLWYGISMPRSEDFYSL